MKRLLARSLAIIIEASLFVLADVIMTRSKNNGNFHGLHRGYFGRSHGLRGVGHSLHAWRDMSHRRRHGRFIS